MLTLYHKPGSCSLASHIVLEESGEPYALQPVDLAAGDQRTEAFLKINPQGRVPVLILDDGEPLVENTAILPYLGKRFGLWPLELLAEAKALSLIGFFAASVHPAFAHIVMTQRYSGDPLPSPRSGKPVRKCSIDISAKSTACWLHVNGFPTATLYSMRMVCCLPIRFTHTSTSASVFSSR
jgi:glutathione S-transferase